MSKLKIKNKKTSEQVTPKVFVGLSGGVDSAVSAALLKKEGYEVTGVFIKAWTPEGYPCNWKEDRRSAMRVAAVLDIPFLTLDLEKEYKREVVDYMIREYKEGKTPNPDVMCNKEIKFGHFLKFALENGADFVATGHYAMRYENHTKTTKNYKNLEPLPSPSPLQGEGEGGEVVLLEGTDKNKDQSYFLWTLTQNQLKHILFPIGHLQKSEVRKLADKFKLPQATRKDSQGICFLGQIDMKDFLKEYVGTKKGDVLNENGMVIGEHDGALLYTIGERHGFKVKNKNTNNEPLYVIAKDIVKNTITVASRERKEITDKINQPNFSDKTKSVSVKNLHWISGKTPDANKKIFCRVRYRGEKVPCQIQDGKIKLSSKQAGIASGQSLVFYDSEICLGGAVIK